MTNGGFFSEELFKKLTDLIPDVKEMVDNSSEYTGDDDGEDDWEEEEDSEDEE